MMTSYVENIPRILELAVTGSPRRILDIGAGFGKFSLLLREALMSIRIEAGDLEPDPEETSVDCVEAAPYFQTMPWHDKLYNEHFHRSFLWPHMAPEAFVPYDLILMIDVVEHHPVAEIKNWLGQVRKISPARILVSTPKHVVFYKEHYYGDGCPVHVSQWTEADFFPFAPAKFSNTTESIIVVLG